MRPACQPVDCCVRPTIVLIYLVVQSRHNHNIIISDLLTQYCR